MRCIHSQYHLFAILPHLEQHHQMKATKPRSLSTTHHFARRLAKRHDSILSPKALTSSLVLGVTSSSGDVTVLLRTTAGLLFVYWIANFVVPEFILKDLQSNNRNEDQKQDNDDSLE